MCGASKGTLVFLFLLQSSSLAKYLLWKQNTIIGSLRWLFKIDTLLGERVILHMSCEVCNNPPRLVHTDEMRDQKISDHQRWATSALHQLPLGWFQLRPLLSSIGTGSGSGTSPNPTRSSVNRAVSRPCPTADLLAYRFPPPVPFALELPPIRCMHLLSNISSDVRPEVIARICRLWLLASIHTLHYASRPGPPLTTNTVFVSAATAFQVASYWQVKITYPSLLNN